MGQCIRCGKDLPAFTVGSLSDVCRECAVADAAAPPAAATPRLPWPVVTYGLIAACAFVFAAMVVTGASPVNPERDQLLAWGADYGPLALGEQPWRMLTSMFVHIGFVHLLVNMWALWNLGRLAEILFDRLTFLLLYATFGLAGSLLSLWWEPRVVSAGASGAIFGVAGLIISALYFGPHHGASQLRPLLRSLLAFAAYNLVFGWIVPGINNAAHIGGLLAGLACGIGLAGGLGRGLKTLSRRRWLVLGGVAVILIAGVVAVRAANIHLVRLESASRAYDRKAYGEAVDHIARGGARLRNDPWAQALLGASQLMLGRPEPARAAIDRAVALEPDYLFAREVQGRIALQQDRNEDAIQIFSDIVRRHPELQRAKSNLGQALANAGRFDEAQPVLEEAIRLDPRDAAAHAAVGFIHARTGRLPEATAALEEAVRLLPGFVEAETLLAEVYEARGMVVEAQAARRRADAADAVDDAKD